MSNSVAALVYTQQYRVIRQIRELANELQYQGNPLDLGYEVPRRFGQTPITTGASIYRVLAIRRP